MEQANARYVRDGSFIFRKIVNELVLVPIHQDVADMECIYTLNDVGASVWERLAEPATRSDLQAALLEEYDADPGALSADLDGFLAEMMAIGAIREVQPWTA